MLKVFKTFCLGVSLLVTSSLAIAGDEAKILSVKKIWDEAPHNAFTDLIRHDGKFLCVFREGKGHVSPDGALRVLSSADGKNWESIALVTSEDSDLRDAKIFKTPDGRLCLAGAGAWHKIENEITHQSFVWYSDDGKNWGEAIPVGDPNFWLWRIVWHKDVAYAMGYHCGKKDHSLRFYHSKDGKDFQPLVTKLNDNGYVNETGMLFLPDETLIAVVRRDPGVALLGTASAPYTDWKFKETNVRVGGPQLLQLADGRIVLGGRDYIGKATTKLWWVDPQQAKLTEIVTFPSGGDTSYPGLVEHDGKLFVSFYSSHEGKTSIYFAEVELSSK